MKQVTEYNIETGEISRVLLLPIHHNYQPSKGFDFIDGDYPDDRYYIIDGVAVERPIEEILEESSSDSLMSDEQVAERDNRHLRDLLLAQSDWTQLPDAPVDAQAWSEYRQKLRDVPQQDGFPMEIDWPAQPQ